MRFPHWIVLLATLSFAFSTPSAWAKKKEPAKKPAAEQKESVDTKAAQPKAEFKSDDAPAQPKTGPGWGRGRGGGGCCCWADCPLRKTTATPAATTEKKEPAKTPEAVAPARTAGAGPGPGWGGGGRGMPEAVRTFHQLLSDHEKIKRSVKDIPGGVSTVTTSSDPKVVETLTLHVEQMKERMEKGQPIRRWDPLFDALFQNYDKIVTKVENIDNGLKVTQTSEDPMVTKLIRQHARRGVSEFVSDGWDRVHEPTPLPDGYPQPK